MTAMLNTMRHSGQLTILFRDDFDDEVPGILHADSLTLWVNANQADDEILDVVNMAMLQLLRPQLTVVDSPAAPQVGQVITPRPQLRLVRAGGGQ